jgi:hypothetical protein
MKNPRRQFAADGYPALSGVSALSDTSLPYKHFEEFSNTPVFLRLD